MVAMWSWGPERGTSAMWPRAGVGASDLAEELPMRALHPVPDCLRLRGPLFALSLCLAAPAWAAWPHDGVTHPVLGVAVSGQQLGLVAISDGAGGAYVSWQDDRTGDTDLYLQRIAADGTIVPGWPVSGLGICTAPGLQTEQRMVADGTGGVIVVWSDRRSFANYDIYAQRILADGSIAPGTWVANGVPVATLGQDDVLPSICSDGAGGAFVVFEVRLSGSDYDIYRARIFPDGTNSGPVPLYIPVDLSVNPWAVSDGAGGCVTVFSSNLPGNYDIIAFRFNAGGAVWGPTTLCNAPNTQYVPQVLSDDSGGFYVAWLNYRTGFGDVYATHINGQGIPTPGWSLNGTAVENLSAIAYSLSTAPDGSGGLLVAWHDDRYGSSPGNRLGDSLRNAALGFRRPRARLAGERSDA